LVYRQNALRAALNVTLAYLEERRKTEERIFEDIGDIQSSAQRFYEQHLRTIDRVAALGAFEGLVLVQADGSRRSAELLFDGGRAADGVNVFGVGSFMANGGAMTANEKREIYAAYLVLRDMGPIILPRLNSLYGQ